MLNGPNVILALKVAVATVTVLLILAIVAILLGRKRLHGQLNTLFTILTLTAVLGLEVIIRVVDPSIFDQFTPEAKEALRIHLMFAIPSAVLVPTMWTLGWFGWRRLHLSVAVLFSIAWIGTVVTGLFYLPSDF